MSINDVYLQLRQAWSQSLPASPDQLFRKLAEIIEGSTPAGLGTMSTQDADSVNITGGTITGVTFPGVLGTIASQDADNVNITGGSISLAAITGLGSLASQNADNVAITGGTIPSSVITGLGSMAGQNANNVNISGGTITGVSFPGVLGTIASQDANNVVVTGGAIDNVTVGNTTSASVVNALRMSTSPTGLQTTIAFDPTTGEQDTYLKAVYSGRVLRTGKITSGPPGFGNLTAPWRFAYQDGTSVASVNQSAVIAYMAASGNAASVTNNEEQSQRNAIMGLLAVTGQYGSVNAPDPYIAFVAGQMETSFSSTQGGTGWPGSVTPGAPYFRGSGFGGNSLGILRNGATNWTELMAHEFTISSQTGSSAGRKFGIHISKKNDDAVAAVTGDEAAIVIAAHGTVPWNMGLQFNWLTGAGDWPFDNTSTLIGIMPQVYPIARDRSFRPANIGLDLREATFTTGAILTNGFLLTDAGNVIWTVPTVTPPTLTANNQIGIYAVNNTNVRIIYRGTDGTTRQSGNIPVS